MTTHVSTTLNGKTHDPLAGLLLYVVVLRGKCSCLPHYADLHVVLDLQIHLSIGFIAFIRFGFGTCWFQKSAQHGASSCLSFQAKGTRQDQTMGTSSKDG